MRVLVFIDESIVPLLHDKEKRVLQLSQFSIHFKPDDSTHHATHPLSEQKRKQTHF